MSLFDPPRAPAAPPPLAERMRPGTLEEIVGQDDLTTPGSALRTSLDRHRLASMILWGPPGSGKTTLARLIARTAGLRFVAFSAVLSGIKEVKEVMAAAEREHRGDGRPTLLFIDEIHRFNRAQQDAFLPHVEQGTILLVGATTENPSFAVNAALLSRCSVQVLQPLSEEHLVSLLRRALADSRGLKEQRMSIGDEELRLMAARAGGDARRALNALETLSLIVAGRIDSGEGPGGKPVTRQEVDRALARAALLYDASGEEHFNLISALHKSLRNSDADAALYWLARMLESGEDPLYVARRMIRFASEDVGNADPGALRVALSARDAFVSLGMPEGALALAQAAIYLAATPKSNSVYEAYGRVIEELRRGGADPVPLALRNAPTTLMRDLGYGRDYAYAHDEPDGTADLECLPDRLRGRRYYRPKPVGHERALGERLQEMESRRAKKAAGTATSAPRPARTDE